MSQTPVTVLLQRLSQGDPQAEHELLPLVYGELHRLAEIAMCGERRGHTLQPTALVHELWLRFSGMERRAGPLHPDRVLTRDREPVSAWSGFGSPPYGTNGGGALAWIVISRARVVTEEPIPCETIHCTYRF